MRISDWSSDVCSSDLHDDARHRLGRHRRHREAVLQAAHGELGQRRQQDGAAVQQQHRQEQRSEEHTSELQSLMRISYAVFCLQKKNRKTTRLTSRPNIKTSTTCTACI